MSIMIKRFVRKSFVFKATATPGFSRRNITTDSNPDVKGPFERLKTFIWQNRQALVNFLGTLLVVKTSIYHMQLKEAWGNLTAEMDELKKQNEDIKAVVSDKAWLLEVENKVRKAGPNTKGTIFNEINRKLETENKINNKDSALDEVALDALGLNSSDGKMI